MSSSETVIAFFVFISTVLLVWYLYFRRCYLYWEKLGFPTIPPTFPMGNLGGSMIGKENVLVRYAKIYAMCKKAGLRHVGIYAINGPIYMPIDMDIIKRIVNNDFEYFTDRGFYYDEKKYPLSAHLVVYPGKKWRDARNKLSPGFTSRKLKTMYAHIFMKNVENLVQHFQEFAKTGEEFSAKQYAGYYSSDIMVSLALGCEFNILNNADQESYQILKGLSNRPLWITLKHIFFRGCLSRPGNIVTILWDNNEAKTWIEKAIRYTIKFREENNAAVNDLFQFHMELDEFSWTEKVANTFVYLFAGVDTSTGVTSACFHELAHNSGIQEKLRQEIHKNLGRDLKTFSYEKIVNLPYLDSVINETMRMYPSGGVLNRECVKDYAIPGTDLVLNKGTAVVIPLLGLHRDPEYFFDPMEFKPERFEDGFVPFAFMPFGEGPRVCIGQRLGLIMIKLCVAAVVSQFKMSPGSNSERHIDFCKTPSAALVLAGDVPVKLESLQMPGKAEENYLG